jgi:hypothetical protein
MSLKHSTLRSTGPVRAVPPKGLGCGVWPKPAASLCATPSFRVIPDGTGLTRRSWAIGWRSRFYPAAFPPEPPTSSCQGTKGTLPARGIYVKERRALYPRGENPESRQDIEDAEDQPEGGYQECQAPGSE